MIMLFKELERESLGDEIFEKEEVLKIDIGKQKIKKGNVQKDVTGLGTFLEANARVEEKMVIMKEEGLHKILNILARLKDGNRPKDGRGKDRRQDGKDSRRLDFYHHQNLGENIRLKEQQLVGERVVVQLAEQLEKVEQRLVELGKAALQAEAAVPAGRLVKEQLEEQRRQEELLQDGR